MQYIVGLGNPGARFKSTKHNIGSTLVLKLAKEHNIKLEKVRSSSILGRGQIAGEDVTLVIPRTYMNLSGEAVRELFEKDMKAIDELLVICDDVNLDLGRMRLRRRGSSGGHKGLQSIIDALGKDDFARLRIGIATGLHRKDLTNYVLTPFKRKHQKEVSDVMALAKEAVSNLLKNGIEETMHKFNKRIASATVTRNILPNSL